MQREREKRPLCGARDPQQRERESERARYTHRIIVFCCTEYPTFMAQPETSQGRKKRGSRTA